MSRAMAIVLVTGALSIFTVSDAAAAGSEMEQQAPPDTTVAPPDPVGAAEPVDTSLTATSAMLPTTEPHATSTSAPPASTEEPTTTTSVAPADTDGPTDGELWAAALAVVGAIVLGGAVIWMVARAHDVQRRLAEETMRRGGRIATASAPSAAGAEAAAQIVVSGPTELRVGISGEFTVPKNLVDPVWTLTGIDSFGQARPDAWTFRLTAHETSERVVLSVASGDLVGRTPPMAVLPPLAAESFTMRLFVRNWGLVVVAIVVVFGAIALGLIGILDGGNFVALVAPLAALLGVTAISGGDNGDKSAGGG